MPHLPNNMDAHKKGVNILYHRGKCKMKLLCLVTLLSIFHCVLIGEAPRENSLDPKASNYKSGVKSCPTCIVREGLVAWWKFNGNFNDDVGTYDGANSGAGVFQT